MKVTRRFVFSPRWKSRGFSYESTKDLYSLPGFNEIAKLLNDKGWEIKKFEIIPDKGVCGYQKTDAMNGLAFYCDKEASVFVEEKSYSYTMSSETEIKMDPYYGLTKLTINDKEW